MKDKKKKRPDAVKQPDPKRLAEAKRLLNTRKISEENQALLFKFDKDYPGLTFDDADRIIIFVHWIETRGYYIVDGKKVYCFPFSRLARFKNLK